MIYIYVKTKDLLVQRIEFDIQNSKNLPDNILWVDLISPSEEEIYFTSDNFNINILEQRRNIHSNAKYWEDNALIDINLHFIDIDFQTNSSFNMQIELVTLIIKNQILFSIRDNEFKFFKSMQSKILASPKNFEDGYDIVDKIFEIRVEKDTDFLEIIDKNARELHMKILEQKGSYDYNNTLKEISGLQNINMNIKSSLFNKRKLVASLLKSDKIDGDIKQNLSITLKEINSLIDFSISQFNILDNMQAILSNQINIEQNQIIKLFTIVTVAMMPPTLIAAIYGMNFKYMPELKYHYAYPICLFVMLISMIAPIVIFKKKKWI